jgi:threonine aldolase
MERSLIWHAIDPPIAVLKKLEAALSNTILIEKVHSTFCECGTRSNRIVISRNCRREHS